MKNSSTTDLLNHLSECSFLSLEQDLTETAVLPTIEDTFNAHFQTEHIQPADIVKNCSGYLSKSYVYALISGEKKKPSRDSLLLLCIGAHMDLKSTRRVLEIFAHRPLYPKDPRDVILAACINQKSFDIEDINELLLANNQPPFVIRH